MGSGSITSNDYNGTTTHYTSAAEKRAQRQSDWEPRTRIKTPRSGNCLGPRERGHCGKSVNGSVIYCDSCYTKVYGRTYEETPK